MIETLEKMSGKTHESLVEQKTFTEDKDRVIGRVDSPVTYTMSTKQRSVIQFNDMLFIPPRNSMVFRAGESPIWNRRTTILPMSWRLLKDTITQPGVEDYSLQTVPTLSSALDFDVRKNQPDFYQMLTKRVKQARLVDYMRERYMDVHGYSEGDMARLDPDVLSDEIMIAINENLYGTGIDKNTRDENTPWAQRGFATKEEWQEDLRKREVQTSNKVVQVARDNVELKKELAVHEDRESEMNMKVYADGRISRRMLVTQMGQVSRELANVLAIAYEESKQHFSRNSEYVYNEQQELLRDAETGKNYIVRLSEVDEATFNEASKNQNTSVYSESDDIGSEGLIRFDVKDDFIKHLSTLSSWSHIAGGRFESEVIRAYDQLKTLD